MCWSAAAIATSLRRVADNPGARLSGTRLLRSSSTRRRPTASSPRRSGCARTSLRRAVPRLLLASTAIVQQRLLHRPAPEIKAEIRRVLATAPPRTNRRTGSPRLRRRTARSRRCARRASSTSRRCSNSLSRTTACGDGGGAGIALRGADRGGGSPDGQRAARSGPDPLQGGRLGLADREGHPSARPGGEHSAQLSTPPAPISSACRRRRRSGSCGSGRYGDRGRRTARGWLHHLLRLRSPALMSSAPSCGRSESRARGLRAWPWPRSASRKSPATVGASRRRAPPSIEVARTDQSAQRPGRVVRDVAGEPEFAAGPQDRARSRRRVSVLHEAALPMPALRPRVGMDQIDARERSSRAARPRTSIASPW